MCGLAVEARHQPPGPDHPSLADLWGPFPSPLLTAFAAALHKHCGLSIIFDEKSFIFKF